MPFALGFALAVSAALTPATTTAVAPVVIHLPAQTVREQVEEYFADAPIMVAIAQCESHFRQFNKDGDVYRGKQNTKDVGVMQINEYYHLDTTEKLGYDIYSIEGNMAYARYLYEREGTVPWASSQPCWGKSNAAKALLAFGNK